MGLVCFDAVFDIGYRWNLIDFHPGCIHFPDPDTITNALSSSSCRSTIDRIESNTKQIEDIFIWSIKWIL